MTITTAQILTTIIILIWFDWSHLFHFKKTYNKTTGARIRLTFPNRLKLYFGYNLHDFKSSARKKWHKVLFCYFCQSFWIGVIVASIIFIVTDNYQLSALLVGSNLIMSRLLDYLLGYQSFKS